MLTIPYIADVVELRTWANDNPYSSSALKEDLQAALEGNEMKEAERYARETFEEIAIRANALREAYPFTFDGVTLAPNELKTKSAYLFCLCLNFFEDIPPRIRSVEFEGLAKDAAEKYFCGEAIRIGAPWKTATITDYEILLKMVSNLIPDIGLPVQKIAPAGGDAGWDIVVVSNFADRKFSRVIALGNCATGRTDWRSKGMETFPTYFWEFFSRPPQNRNACLTFLAVPFLMTDEEKLRKTAATSITLDRLRICEHASVTTPAAMRWVEKQRAKALDVPLA
jgi:hypothetical protein